MGAALASLAAVSLTNLGYNLTTYTYGQPRTGNPAYATYVDTLFPPSLAAAGAPANNGGMYRVTHANDGVPQIPPQSAGYRHHSTEFWDSNSSVLVPPTQAETYRCDGQEPADCNQSEPGYGIGGVDGIGINLAHLMYFAVLIGVPLVEGSVACSGAY